MRHRPSLSERAERRRAAARNAGEGVLGAYHGDETFAIAIADSGRLIAAASVSAQEAEIIHRILFPKTDSGILTPASPAVTR